MQAIKTTGIRGFLQWFAQDQPALYKKLAPTLPKVAPAAFSGYRKRMGALRSIYKSAPYTKRAAPERLGDYYSLPTLYVSAPSYTAPPITVDYTSQLSNNPIGYDSSNVVDYTSLNTLPTDSSGNVVSAPSAPGGSVAQAANTGSSNAGTVSAIGSSIASIASSFLSAANMASLMNLVGSQLARAQAGNNPANVSSGSLGVPRVTTTSSTTKMLLLLALAGGAAYFILE
jgi:hypothetical protein